MAEKRKQIIEGMTFRQLANNPFLHATDIPKKGINVKIKEFSFKQAFSRETKKKEDLGVMHVEEYEKPIVVSIRKAKQIDMVINIHYINEKNFGEFTDVLFFRKKVEVVKDNFNNKSAGWNNCVAAVKSGKATVESLEKHYTLDAATKKEIIALYPKK